MIKNILFLAIAALGTYSQSFGHLVIEPVLPSPTLTLDITQIVNLPAIESPKVVVNVPGEMLTVQPTGYVTFKYASCAQAEFEGSVQKVSGVYILKILPRFDVDCMGPTKIRSYSVQYSSDADGSDRVIILNPQTETGYKPF